MTYLNKNCPERIGVKCDKAELVKLSGLDWHSLFDEKELTLKWWIRRAGELAAAKGKVEKDLNNTNKTLVLMTQCRTEDTAKLVEAEKKVEAFRALSKFQEELKLAAEKKLEKAKERVMRFGVHPVSRDMECEKFFSDIYDILNPF